MNKKRNPFTRRTLSSLIVICVGILLYLALSNFRSVTRALSQFFSILSPFIAGIAIAYVLNLPTRFLEKHVFARFARKRTLAILCTFVGALFIVGLLLGLVLPQLTESITRLLGSLPSYIADLNRAVDRFGAKYDLDAETLDNFMVSYNDLLTQLAGWVRAALPNLLGMAGQVGQGIISTLTALIASVYLLAGRDKLLLQCRRVLFAIIPTKTAKEVVRVGHMTNDVFSSFISGKLLDSVIIGVICFVFMSVMNLLSSLLSIPSMAMPYTLLISVIVGITNIIPFFGPFLGAIPSVMILLTVDAWSAVWFTLFIIVLQQFDGNILGPRILGDSTGLPPFWVLVAIIVGGGLFGFLGMLLGVPTMAVLYTLGSDFIEHRLHTKNLNDPNSPLHPTEEEIARPHKRPGVWSRLLKRKKTTQPAPPASQAAAEPKTEADNTPANQL